jgi:hypothetical protein
MIQPSLAGLDEVYGRPPSTGFGQSRFLEKPDFCRPNRGWATFKRPLRDSSQTAYLILNVETPVPQA